jgi:hypothetical protein
MVLFVGSQDHTTRGLSSGSDRFFEYVFISYISDALPLELSVFVTVCLGITYLSVLHYSQLFFTFLYVLLRFSASCLPLVAMRNISLPSHFSFILFLPFSLHSSNYFLLFLHLYLYLLLITNYFSQAPHRILHCQKEEI